MTIEEKAKAYDEAIERAKKLSINGYLDTLDIEYIFPELNECDEERIRKTLLDHFKQNRDEGDYDERWNGLSYDSIITWLEKQGQEEYVLKSSKDEDVRKFMKYIEKEAKAYEFNLPNRGYDIYAFAKDILAWLEKQNNTPKEVTCTQEVEVGNGNINALVTEKITIDKIEPKFKVGDWIVFNGFTLLVNEIVQGYYRTISIGGLHNSYDWDIDNAARLWTIADAKDGEVLANDHHILILKELFYDWNTNGAPYSVKAYCGIKPNGNFEIGKDNWGFCGTLHIHPATKEQSDILFAKMREVGYIWDENKKGLRKIEQKPINKIEPKFKVGDWIVNNNSGGVYQVTEIRDDEYCLWPLDAEIVGYLRIIDVDNEYHLWSIQDARDGDVLYFSDETIVIFKDLYNATTFHSYCHIEDNVFDISKDDMPDWWEGKGFRPATKEQQDILFQKMHEAGYIWDANKKELRKIGQKPVNKMIEPKFRVGDYIKHNKANIICKIVSVNIGSYYVENVGTNGRIELFNAEQNFHLWTIKDAKNGDVLAEDSCIFIIQKLDDNNTAAKTYCTLYDDGDFDDGTVLYFDIDSTKPATKEQCDLLFKKIQEAGYKWDSEKKELKKIHIIDEGKAEIDYCFTKMMNGERVSPTWSEEDETYLEHIITGIKNYYKDDKGEENPFREPLLSWLKSIKQRLEAKEKK